MRPHRPRLLRRRAGAGPTGQFLDLSSNNAPPNLDALWQSGMRVLALKATEGTTYAWAAGLALADGWHARGGVVWWYHFARPGDPAGQARIFLGHIGGHLQPTDRLILDAEVAGVDGAFADAFWTQVVALDPVNRREDYGSPYFLRDGGFRPHHGEGLWLADYAAAVEFIPPGWTRLDAWQFTEHGSAPGYTGDVDRSYLYDLTEDDVPYSQWPAGDKQALLNDIEGRLAAPGGKLVTQVFMRLAQWISGRSNTWFNVNTVGAPPPGGSVGRARALAPGISGIITAQAIRWSRVHLQQQVVRFLRIFAVTYVPLAIGLGRLDGKALLGLIAPTLLVVWRQLFPTIPVPSIPAQPTPAPAPAPDVPPSTPPQVHAPARLAMLPEPSGRKTGRRPKPDDPRDLKLARYLTTDLPKLPGHLANDQHVPAFPMLLNNRLGICGEAGWLHGLQILLALIGRLWTPSDAQALDLYERITGYNPADPNSDQGTVLRDLLRWVKANAADGGQKIVAYGAIDPKDHATIKAAIYLFGFAYVGVDLTDDAYKTEGVHWHVTRGPGGQPDPNLGHCIIYSGWDRHGFRMVTWGQVGTVTYGLHDRICKEAWAIVSPDALNAAGTTATGLDLAALQADLAKITAGKA